MSLYLKHKFCKFLDEFYNSITLIAKDDRLYDKILSQLKNTLVNTYNQQRKAVINEAIDYLLNQNRITFNQDDVAAINSLFESAFSTDLTGIIEDNINDLTQKALKLGIKEIGDSLKTKLAFDVIDKEAAALLGKQNLFWVGNFYNDQVKEKMTRTLHQYFEDGMTIEDAAAKLEVQFFDITDKGISYFESLAEHTTSRVREIGKVNGYVKAGIEYLQVKAIIDDRTSEICRRMNGTIIPVTDAMKLRDKILGASNPEQIKTIAPWRDPSDLPDVASDEGVPYSKVPGGMQFPPYHWNCRTITVAYFQ